MTIPQIQEKLALKIQTSDEWLDKLNDTEPGNYGVEDWDVSVSSNSIWVDVPKKTFTFKKAHFDFTVTLGSSNDGISSTNSKEAKGSGTFKFTPTGNDIEIDELEIEVDLDLMAD